MVVDVCLFGWVTVCLIVMLLIDSNSDFLQSFPSMFHRYHLGVFMLSLC